ncbi:hypothetical protein GYMLUDRAFT_81132 [Collybiopsis luxurians FD-317 M1]|nr:hypothetical protein GYMLUDRAFT_81132 [Collybiopsis luxurians FD-317 M1]
MISGNLQENYADYADTVRFRNEVESGFLLAPHLAAPGPAPPGVPPPVAVPHQIMALLLQINNGIGELKRDSAIVFNRGCGSGNTMAFREVPFPDGTLPSQMNPPLPVIFNVDSIRQLTPQQARQYLLHHRIDVPRRALDRKKKLALAIGCTMTI